MNLNMNLGKTWWNQLIQLYAEPAGAAPLGLGHSFPAGLTHTAGKDAKLWPLSTMWPLCGMAWISPQHGGWALRSSILRNRKDYASL